MEQTWTPSEFAAKRFGLLILNTEIEDTRKVIGLWQAAAYRILVDGGANRFKDQILTQKNDLAPPNLVTGDLDSIRPEVRQFFAENVPIVETPDQDRTDFHKALLQLASKASALNLDYVLAFAENRGRLDQVFSLFETLHHASLDVTLPPVILLSSNSLSWLLSPNVKHVINVSEKEQSCGLIPLGHPAEEVTTTGLKWNLTDGRLAFGHLVSTSNTFSSNTVTVQFRGEGPLLWTQEVE